MKRLFRGCFLRLMRLFRITEIRSLVRPIPAVVSQDPRQRIQPGRQQDLDRHVADEPGQLRGLAERVAHTFAAAEPLAPVVSPMITKPPSAVWRTAFPSSLLKKK